MPECVERWICDVCKTEHAFEENAEQCCWGTIKIYEIRQLEVVIEFKKNFLHAYFRYELHMTMRGEEIILLIKDTDGDVLEIIDVILSPEWFMDDVMEDIVDDQFIEVLGDKNLYSLIKEFMLTVSIQDGTEGILHSDQVTVL